MLAKLLRNKKRPPRLHKLLKEEDAKQVESMIPDVATDERVAKLDHFERNAIHIACANPNTSIDTMDILLEMYATGLEEQDKSGRIPFHVAVAHQTRKPFLQYLIDQYPECIQEKTRFGATPLLVAIEQKAPLTIVKWLYEKDPTALDDRYKFGKNPLHTACSSKASPSVVRWLISMRPSFLKGKDSWGRTPLWRACNDPQTDMDVLYQLLNPVDIHVADRSGMLPLHAAAGNDTPLPMIAAILGAAPEAIRIKDHNGRLPFHTACASGQASLERLQFLLDADHDAIHMIDKQGSLPFHLVCKRKASPDILAFLMEEYPEALRTRELISGAYPYHLACAGGGVSLEVLEIFLEAFPDAATSVDKEQNTTLHMVCKRRPGVEILDFLLERHPEAVSMINKQKSLPLHVAVENRCSWAVMEKLISRHPASVRTINGRGRLPIHDAFRIRAPLEVLVRLAQLFPPGLDVEDNAGKTPEEYTTELLWKKFEKARRNYNFRHAWLPFLICKPKEPVDPRDKKKWDWLPCPCLKRKPKDAEPKATNNVQDPKADDGNDSLLSEESSHLVDEPDEEEERGGPPPTRTTWFSRFKRPSHNATPNGVCDGEDDDDEDDEPGSNEPESLEESEDSSSFMAEQKAESLKRRRRQGDSSKGFELEGFESNDDDSEAS